jgi:tetratricopeptide (TPR) repeat protein
MLNFKNNIYKNLKLSIFLIFCLTTSISAQCLSGNCKNGQGKFKTKSGHIYEGTFVNGKKEGQGTYLWPSGAKYVGAYQNEEANGFGIYTYADGDVYEGNFVNGQKEGKGIYRFKSGSIFTGEFKNGKRNGPGKLYNKQKNTYQEGLWQDDVYIPQDSSKTVNKNDLRKFEVLKLQIAYAEEIEAKYAIFEQLSKQYSSNLTPQLKKENLDARKLEVTRINRIANEAITGFGSEITADSKAYFTGKISDSENKLKLLNTLLDLVAPDQKAAAAKQSASFLDQTFPSSTSVTNQNGQNTASANGSSQSTTADLEKAKSAIEKGEYAAAFDELNNIIEREPENGEAYAQRSRVYIIKSLTDRALADAAKALSINPNNVTALNVRGLGKRNYNDIPGAINDFNKVISIDPRFVKAYINRGIIYRAQNNNVRALADFTKAIEIEPKNVNALYQRANLYNELNKDLEAINDFTLLIAIDPKSDLYYSERAYSYALMGQNMEEVIADSEKALILNPKNVNALTLRGWAKAVKKDWNGSNNDYTAAFALKPDDSLLFKSFNMSVKSHPNPMGWPIVQTRLDLLKNEAERNPNFDAFTRLDEFFRLIRPKQDSNDFKDWDKRAAFDKEADKPRIAYYESLVKTNDRNVCAYYFMAKGSESSKKDLMDKAIYNYDGKNGARCSASAAFDVGRNLRGGAGAETLEAARYYNLAIERDPTLPNVRDWLAKIYISKNPDTPISSSSSSNSSSASQNSTEKNPYKVEEAIREYNKVHSQIETNLQQYLNSWQRYTKADPVMRSMMSGTRQDLVRARESALGTIDKFLKEYGDYLPSSMSSHLTSDGSKFTSLPY